MQQAAQNEIEGCVYFQLDDTILDHLLRACPNSLADLVWVEVVVHQLVDDVVRVLIDELQAHRL